MNIPRSLMLAFGVMAGFGLLMMFLLMGTQEEQKAEINKTAPSKIASGPTPSAPKTAPSETPTPKAETPSVPTPEVVDNRGAVAKVLDNVKNAFDGYCSVRNQVVHLTDKEVTINPHPDKCRVLGQKLKGEITLLDEAGDPVDAQGQIEKDIVQARAKAGFKQAVWKISLCSRSETRPLNMNCEVVPTDNFK